MKNKDYFYEDLFKARAKLCESFCADFINKRIEPDELIAHFEAWWGEVKLGEKRDDDFELTCDFLRYLVKNYDFNANWWREASALEEIRNVILSPDGGCSYFYDGISYTVDNNNIDLMRDIRDLYENVKKEPVKALVNMDTEEIYMTIHYSRKEDFYLKDKAVLEYSNSDEYKEIEEDYCGEKQGYEE